MKTIETYITDKTVLLFILALSLPAVWALLNPGFYGASDDIHIAWLHELDQLVQIRQIPPRFVPDLSFGFGYPLFNFVFPLPFYIAEIIHLIGFSLVGSIKMVFLLSIPVSMYAMYKLLREFTTPILSLAGGVIYSYAPYRATDIYIRGAIGEVVFFAIIPFVVLSIIKLGKVRLDQKRLNLKWIGLGAIFISAIVLTHNIFSYLFTVLTMLLVVMIVAFSDNRKKIVIQESLSIVLGLLISAYFWVPAILDSKLMKYDTVFGFIDHFPTIKQLITPYFGYGASVPGPYDGMSFYIGILNMLVVVLGSLVMFVYRKKFKQFNVLFLFWAGIILLFSLFMTNHRSAFLWDTIPFFPLFQFPWRMLGVIIFASSVFVIGFDKVKHRSLLGVLLILFAVIASFTYFKPQDQLGRGDEYFLNRYIPYPEASDEYLLTQEEYLRLPLSNEERPDMIYPRFFPEDGIIQINELNKLDSRAFVDTKTDIRLNYNKYNFPGWSVLVDGNVTEIYDGKPFGQISFEVPAGMHVIDVLYTETNRNIILNIISLTAMLTSIMLVIDVKLEKHLTYIRNSFK